MKQQVDNINMNEKEDEVEINLLDLFNYYRKKIIFIIIGFVVGAIIAGLVTKFLITPKYTATAKVYMVSASNNSVVNLADLSIGTSLSEDYAELLHVRPIVEAVSKENDLGYTYEQLNGMISISTVEDTRILKIAAVSAKPKEAKIIANALAEKAVTEIPKLMGTTAPNIAERAITPKFKSSPSLKKNTMLGALGGMVLVLAVLTFLFITDDTIKTEEDIEKYLGIIPLTVIPDGNVKYGSYSNYAESKMNKIKMDSIQELPYAVEESINRLRINVSFLGNEIKKIMVVSTLPNEGKSFVTMQMWKQMANAGIKSVLVDADMRNSVLVKKNDMERQDGKEMKGLVNYLAEDFSLDEVIYESPFENGYIIPNVENIINPSMLLESDKFGNMLNELSKDYRYVFVDAPPLGLVSDAEKIGSMCDGAILVIRSGEITRAEVKNSIKQLERSGCKILGVVLNRATDLKNKYSKQKYYSGK